MFSNIKLSCRRKATQRVMSLPLTRKEVHICPRLFICLSVSKIKLTQKHMHRLVWNIACRQTPGHLRTDQLFEPNSDQNTDAKTGLVVRHLIGYGNLKALPRLTASNAAIRGTLRQEKTDGQTPSKAEGMPCTQHAKRKNYTITCTSEITVIFENSVWHSKYLKFAPSVMV